MKSRGREREGLLDAAHPTFRHPSGNISENRHPNAAIQPNLYQECVDEMLINEQVRTKYLRSTQDQLANDYVFINSTLLRYI